jgi:hypothetical protein
MDDDLNILDDPEMNAIAQCLKGLEPLKNNPRALRRVFDFIGGRYVDGLKMELARIDAEIEVVQKRLAREKYDAIDRDKSTTETHAAIEGS